MSTSSPAPESGPIQPTRRTREFLVPGRTIGRFQIRKLAGMGGMGEVYQAWDPLLERNVALKAVRSTDDAPEENLERFRREALALAQVSHPNVCQVHDMVTSELGTFIAMEWLDGETLETAAQHMDRREILRLVQEIAEGLGAAHTQSLVHRDLKPGNIMISTDGHAKILDFGLARHLERNVGPPLSKQEVLPSPSAHSDRPALTESELPTGLIRDLSESSSGSSDFSDPLTQQGFFMGSPRYASPEQIRGHHAGAPSDVFSLGVMLWELLSGEHPFPGEGRERFEAIVANRRRSLKAKASRRLSALLDGMLARHPKDRLTAPEAALQIRQILRPLGRIGVSGLSAAVTLTLGLFGYVLLGRGVIADLARERPVGIAILPVINRTGDTSLLAELRWIIPDLLGSGLQTSHKLRVLPMEAISAQHLPQDAPMSANEIQRLQRQIGAELCLISELHRTPKGAWLLTYRLLDRNGKVRFQGQETQVKGRVLDLQPLSHQVVLELLRAVDPLRPRPGEEEIQIPPEAFKAYALGEELMERGNYKEALLHLRTAAESAPYFASAIVQYGACLRKLGNPSCDMAIQWGRWAGRSTRNRRGEIKALTQLGLLRMEQGRWDESQSAFTEALDISQVIGDEDLQAAVLNNRGFLALERKRPQEAEQYLSQALIIERRLGKRTDEIRTLNNLAVIAKERGDFEVAERHYLQVLGTARELGNRETESLALNNLGDVAIGKGAFPLAEIFFKDSLRIKREIGLRLGTMISLANLGILERVQRKWDSSRTLFIEALALCRELEKTPMEALVLFQSGCLELEAGDTTAALRRFQRAGEIHQKLQDASALAQDLAGQAEALMRARATSKALALLKEAREKDTENTFVHRAEARAYVLQGMPAEARRQLEMALALATKAAPEELPGLRERLGRL